MEFSLTDKMRALYRKLDGMHEGIAWDVDGCDEQRITSDDIKLIRLVLKEAMMNA